MKKNSLKMGLFIGCMFLCSGRIFSVTALQYSMIQMEGDLNKLLQKANMTGLSAAEKTRVHTLLSSLSQYNPESAKNFRKQFESVKVVVPEKVVAKQIAPTPDTPVLALEEKIQIIQIAPPPLAPGVFPGPKKKEVVKSEKERSLVKEIQEIEFISGQVDLLIQTSTDFKFSSVDKGYYHWFIRIQDQFSEIEKIKNNITKDQYDTLVRNATDVRNKLLTHLQNDLSDLLQQKFGSNFPGQHIEVIGRAAFELTDNFLLNFYGPETVGDKTPEQKKNWEELDSYNTFAEMLRNGKINEIFKQISEHNILTPQTKLQDTLFMYLFKPQGPSLANLARTILLYIKANTTPENQTQEKAEDREDYKRFFNPLYAVLQDYQLIFGDFVGSEKVNKEIQALEKLKDDIYAEVVAH
jgi:hypothetical protein